MDNSGSQISRDSVRIQAEAFERFVLDMFLSAGYDVQHDPLLAGQRLDAIVHVQEGVSPRRLGVEVRYFRSGFGFPLDSALFQLAYLINRGLIDNGMVIINVEPRPRDQTRAAEMGMAILTPDEVREALRSPGRLLGLFLRQGAALKPTVELPGATTQESAEPKKRIFVAIQFSDHNDDVFNFGISNAASRLGMEAYRVADIEHNELIIDQIRDGIDKADGVIAELDDN